MFDFIHNKHKDFGTFCQYYWSCKSYLASQFEAITNVKLFWLMSPAVATKSLIQIVLKFNLQESMLLLQNTAMMHGTCGRLCIEATYSSIPRSWPTWQSGSHALSGLLWRFRLTKQCSLKNLEDLDSHTVGPELK